MTKIHKSVSVMMDMLMMDLISYAYNAIIPVINALQIL